MYLSFDWNHHLYKDKWCRYCDNGMQNICTKREIKKIRKRQQQLNSMNVEIQRHSLDSEPGINDEDIHTAHDNDEVLSGDGIHVETNPIMAEILNVEEEMRMINNVEMVSSVTKEVSTKDDLTVPLIVNS